MKAATIGIGAGPDTDGQVLVYADALGMTQGFKPKFLRHFANVCQCMTDGVQAYVKAVKTSDFPNAEEATKTIGRSQGPPLQNDISKVYCLP